ncbi:MAG: MFS transporter [Planctomycetota bacterium]|jgi:GPH family glycoside/pentoside/hexuronide:cation symporter
MAELGAKGGDSPGSGPAPPLSLATKLVYGSGDWGLGGFVALRQIFYAIFLTDVVGLDPRLASVSVLVAILWDAINDPLVGWVSDRVRTRWGRRRPFLLLFALPFGLSFLLLWWAPPWESQAALMVHVTLAFMAADTIQTLIAVPFQSLTPALTQDYDERTSLAGFRMFFNLSASLVTAVAAPMIVDATLEGGGSLQQGYLVVAALFGGSAVIPYVVMFFVVRERTEDRPLDAPAFGSTALAAWKNVPFRFATGLYVLNWITFDLVALMLPFFLTYWVAGGDMLYSVTVVGESLALESAVFAVLLLTAVAALPFWVLLSRRFGKRVTYVGAMGFWAAIQFLLLMVQPGQAGFILVLALLAGVSVSSAHVMPDAIFPDVIEWDELRTRRRNEGVYYGAKNLLRKLSGAVAIFFALQVLGWFGYQKPPEGARTFVQSEAALTAIRILTGPTGMLLLLCAMVTAWFYPLTRERHERIRKLLGRRRK